MHEINLRVVETVLRELYFDSGSAQDCSISITNALEILQSCAGISQYVSPKPKTVMAHKVSSSRPEISVHDVLTILLTVYS